MDDVDRRLMTIFSAALERGTAEGRASYLDEACGGDEGLRDRVEALLRAHERGAGFLDPQAPPGHPAATEAAAWGPPSPREGETLDPALAPEAPGAVIGPYKLLQAIGEGGMGTVYMAEQAAPVRRKVALKVVKPGMDSRQVLARFDAERQALALMDHPNIARVLDAGATGRGRPYFVMELVNGVPITRFCDESRLTPRERLELFISVCRAVQHAHQKGVIHRDIKPSNVLVALYDGKPVPKVIDFGVAKAIGEKLTEATLFTGFGTVVGTPEYMSPEQAELNQLDVDTRSDIYSLGVLLYELLTGTTPLQHERVRRAAVLEVLRLIREEEPERPSRRLSSTEQLPSLAALRNVEPRRLANLVHGELDWIVMKALEKDRDRRYMTANDLATDVERHLADEAVLAGPPSAAYRLRKLARRNRAPLLMVGLVLAFLVALGSLAGWIVRDRAARRAAIEQEASRAFGDAERWMRQDRWPEALEAVKRIDGVLAGGGSAIIRERLERLRDDATMMIRLEEVRLLATEMRSNWHEWESVHEGYARAFADFGIDVLGLPPEEAAARVRMRDGITAPLARALDVWACTPGPTPKSVRDRIRGVAALVDTDPWRRQVREALARDDVESLDRLTKSAARSPLSRDDLAFLQHGLRASGREAEALEILRLAQRRYPNDFWANYFLAHELFWAPSSSSGEVVPFARAAVALRPACAAANLILGLSLQRQGELDEAMEYHDRAVALAPENPFARHDRGWTFRLQGKLDEAEADLLRAIELWPENVHAYGFLAQMRLEQQRPVEAITALQKLVDLQPRSPEPLLRLAKALFGAGKPEEAVAAIRRSLEIDPTNQQAYEILLEHGRAEEAVALSRRSIEADPEDVRFQGYLARGLRALNRLDEAAEVYLGLSESGPNRAWALTNLALVRLDQGRLDESTDQLRRTLEIQPDRARTHFQLGWNLYLQGDLDEALTSFNTARELALRMQEGERRNLGLAFNNAAWNLVTDIHKWTRHSRIAVELARAGVELRRTAVTLNTLGVALYRHGDDRGAIRTLNEAMGAPENFVACMACNQIFLAMAHRRCGESDEASRCYAKAVRWLGDNQNQDRDLDAFRVEAARLLGLAESED